LYHIPESYRPKGNYLIYLYTNGLLGHLSFLLNKKGPKTFAEAYNMAIRFEKNISLSRTNDRTMDILGLIKLVSFETFTDDPQERREQVFNQQNEDVIKEKKPKQDDKVPTRAPPSDEVIQELVSPAHQSEDEVSCFPLQDSDDTLSHDSGNEGEMESPKESNLPCCTTKYEGVVFEDETMTHIEDTQVFKTPAQEEKVSCPPLLVFDNAILCDKEDEEEMSKNASNPACYDIDNDIDDNIDEFIHVGRRGWDAVGYDMDPIYDIESHLQVLPLQLSQQALDQRQQGDEIFIDAPQTPKVDQVPYLPDDFRSYLEVFDDYPSEHLDLPSKNDYQPPLCSGFDGGKNIVCLKKDSRDLFPQPPLIALSCCVIKGVIGNYIEFPLKQTRESKGWLKTTELSLSSQCFNLPLGVCQSSARSLSIPSGAPECEDVIGGQFTSPQSQCFEPWTFHDPFRRWIECSPQIWTWQDFIPPTRLHELDFMISDDMIYALTHVIFVLDLSLFWFMMKHKGRYCGTLLDWLQWLFDYNIQQTGKYR
jgi:hypothetical protein